MGQRLPPGERHQPARSGEAGFTLMELVLVLFIVGLLAAIAVPNISDALTRGRETALIEDLSVMRRALDDFHADRAEYPESLETLVEEKYLKFIPPDPVAEGDSGWQLSLDPDEGGVTDVRSSSARPGLNGKPYEEW